MPSVATVLCSPLRRRQGNALLASTGARPRRSPAGLRQTLLLAGFAIVLAACGGGGGSPAVPNACAYVNLNQTLPGQLPGSNVTYSIVTSPAKGELTLTNPLTGDFTYDPFTDARGEDQFQFQAHGGDGSSNVATFRLIYRPRIMPLGDSITWGGAGDDPNRHRFVSYRLPLRDDLIARGFRIDYVGTLQSGENTALESDPQHEGHGGWTTRNLVEGRNPDNGTGSGDITAWLNDARGRPDVVLLHSGTNDLNSTDDQSGAASWVDALLDEVDAWEAANWPITVVVSQIINTMPGDPESTEQRMEETRSFNRNVASIVNRRISAGDRLVLVDHESRLDGAEYYLDFLHPSPAGYQRMAQVWAEALVGFLPKCP